MRKLKLSCFCETDGICGPASAYCGSSACTAAGATCDPTGCGRTCEFETCGHCNDSYMRYCTHYCI